MTEVRNISSRHSWTHRLALDAMLKHFARLRKLHDSSDDDADSYFIALAEFTLWAVIVDEGFVALLRGQTTPGGADYSHLKARSIDGRHVNGLRWARNKISHCVARPVHDEAGKLGVDFILGKSTIGPDMRWLPVEVVLQDALDPQRARPDEQTAYEELLAGNGVYDTVLSCVRWLSEVRYDHRDPTWQQRWFDSRG